MLLLWSANFLKKITFSENSFWSTIRVSNSLDPDQVSPNLGPNCLIRLSADDKIRNKQGNNEFLTFHSPKRCNDFFLRQYGVDITKYVWPVISGYDLDLAAENTNLHFHHKQTCTNN